MNLLFLTFVFPLVGFLLLSFSRGRFSENLSALIGVGSVGLSAATAAYVIWQFNVAPPEGGAYSQLLWQWMSVDGFAPNFTLYLDGLSVTMLGVVTGVGFLIHLFASWYMRGEAGYSRFFSYTNLFIASMLFLILGDNLLFIYFGWEGVGLCSYLLIGFYYSNRNNGNAALKAFIVTRIGDVFMAIGLFILFVQLGTLNVQELLVLAPQKFQAGDTWMVLATLMLLTEEPPPQDDAQLQEDWQQIHALTERMAGLLKTPANNAPQGQRLLSELVNDLGKNLRILTPSLQIRWHGPDDLQLSQISQWQRVLANLGYNACDAGATVLEVRCEKHSDDCYIQISDDGPRQHDQDATRQGMGIGLALVETTLAALGGSLELMFDRQWTVARIHLPLTNRGG